MLSVDLQPPPEPLARAQLVDLRDFGQAVECLVGAGAVVHLAAIAAPGIFTEAETFRSNATSTFNVFEAARVLGLGRVVWASSETVFGLPFERERPAYVPVDVEHPAYPESSYALAKLLGEEMARQLARRSGIPVVGLRFSNIVEPDGYARFPEFWADARSRSWNLWGYVDVRDVARSCRLALEAPVEGAAVVTVAACDTVMNRPSRDLVEEVYPGVEVRGALGEFETLLSIAEARALLGYEPRFGWRDHVG